jgi:hypothetical protein
MDSSMREGQRGARRAEMEVKPFGKEIVRIETAWGIHTVTPGRGKYEGQFVAESRGWGGARGYFRAFSTEAAAAEHIERQTRPLDPKDIIEL